MRSLTDARDELIPVDTGNHWVRELRPTSSESVEAVCGFDTIAAASAQLGVAPVQWGVDVSARVAERTIRRFPELGGSRSAEATLRLGTEQVVIFVLRSLDAGHMVHSARSGDTLKMVEEYVHRRVPMDLIWAGMRCGHAWISEEIMAACRTLVQRDQRAEELEAISQRLFELVITYASELGDIHRTEEAAWSSSAEFARDDALRSILAGEDIDEDDASRALRYSLSHHHVSIVAEVADGTESQSLDLPALVSRLLHQIGASSTLIIVDSTDDIRAWGGFAGTPPPVHDMSIEPIPGVHVSIAVGSRGIAGFLGASEEASRISSIASRVNHRPSRIVSYDQVSLLGLLLENARYAAAFVNRELGRLAEDAAPVATLRETVLAYLECRHSPRAAGERLYVAKNTVIYRLKRAEELIGRPLDERPVETWAALLIAKSLNP